MFPDELNWEENQLGRVQSARNQQIRRSACQRPASTAVQQKELWAIHLDRQGQLWASVKEEESSGHVTT